MPTDSGTTISPWMATADIPRYEPLRGELETDVCIIGAGIAGITTAYLLARGGRRVVVLDDGPVAGGETGRTTAHLVCALDDFYSEIEKMHGAKGARLAAQSHMAAIDRIESIVREEGIDCDFERLDGYWFVEGDEGHDLDDEAEAARRAGVPGVERVKQIEGAPFPTLAALRFPNQAQFHPLKYIAALARAIERDGGRIFCGSHVDSLENEKERPLVTTADGATVGAHAVVFATNTPVNDRVKIHTKQAAYRTYVVGVRVPHGAVPRALYWDTLDPYHYVRLTTLDGGGEMLIVGGEDHKTGQAEDEESRFATLERWTRQRFPMAGTVDFRWSGQVMEPVDYMAFIGRNPGDEHVFIATGDSGNGMTHGTIAGILITDLILGRKNEWSTLYDPSRISLRATPTFLKENLNVAVQYGDLATPGEISDIDQLPHDTGAVMRQGVKKVAVYRDEAGDVHMRSAVCPHLYCVVDWNSSEKTWDCPCHGSRFDRFGKVINGPAISDLAAVDDEAGLNPDEGPPSAQREMHATQATPRPGSPRARSSRPQR
jgi:glycine/D-amino acid oxidase-like deaminating enzyme/nitrite reductase/ring-hydroxylating ferredoxin subunit